jgi:hypothetical protein
VGRTAVCAQFGSSLKEKGLLAARLAARRKPRLERGKRRAVAGAAETYRIVTECRLVDVIFIHTHLGNLPFALYEPQFAASEDTR